MTETRIRWEGDPYGVNWPGYVGTHEGWLFQIFKAKAAADDRTLVLMSAFPGALGDYRYSDDRDELERAAERWLEEFVSSLGAVFPEPEKPDPDCEECGFGLPRHDKDCSYYPGTTAATTEEKEQP